MNKTILVIFAKDSSLSDVEFNVPSIREVYGQSVDLGIATYGARPAPPSVALKSYADENGILFFDAPRQDFLPSDREHRCCGIIGQLTISRYFYNLGYEEVYLLHPDTYQFRDALPYYRRQMQGQWSFVTIFWHLFETDITFEQAVEWGGQKTFEKYKVTLPDAFLTYNKAFVEYLFSKYFNEKNMWQEIFHKFRMVTDAGLFDVAKNFLGWIPKIIGQGGFEKDFVMIDYGMFYTRGKAPNKQELLDIVAKNYTICFMHNRTGTAVLKSS